MMSSPCRLALERLPFSIGAFSEPANPQNLPNTFPLHIRLNETVGLFSQENTPELSAILRKAYDWGSTVGNAMDDSELGKKYCDDFLSFITQFVSPPARILEIGAGRGFLTHRLLEKGFRVTALEPGNTQATYWKKYGVEIIPDYFPSPKVGGKFDAIVFYGVLEHIDNYTDFLRQVVSQLEPAGSILLSVPDCRPEIESGDPSMLLHEHYHYFTSTSLRRMLQYAGLTVKIVPSLYGRALYACATISDNPRVDEIAGDEMSLLRQYPDKVKRLSNNIQKRLAVDLGKGDLGIYCPARALALLPYDASIRFFDDSPDLHGKYYPPFPIAIENRDDLFAAPPKTLWIMSRTFGERLKNAIRDFISGAEIVLLSDLLIEVPPRFPEL